MGPSLKSLLEQLVEQNQLSKETATALLAIDETIAANDAAKRLSNLFPNVPTNPSLAQQSNGVVCRAFWWGFHFDIPIKDLHNFLGAAITIIAAEFMAACVTVPPVVIFVAACAAFILVSTAVATFASQDKGIYVSMSWFAPNVFIATPK